MALPYLSTVRLDDDASKDLGVIGVMDDDSDGTYDVEFSDASDGSMIAHLTLSEARIEPAQQSSPMLDRLLPG